MVSKVVAMNHQADFYDMDFNERHIPLQRNDDRLLDEEVSYWERRANEEWSEDGKRRKRRFSDD